MWSEMFLKRLMRRSWTIKQFSSEKGLALLMVLWVLAVLSVIVLSFAFMARTEVFSTISFRDGMEKKFLAEAGIERGIMELFYRNANKNQMSAIEGSEIVTGRMQTTSTDSTGQRTHIIKHSLFHIRQRTTCLTPLKNFSLCAV